MCYKNIKYKRYLIFLSSYQNIIIKIIIHLNIMNYFTYWKASDIWINSGEGVNQKAVKDIQNIFEKGVTIWSDPTKIGKVSVYDNQ